MGRFVILLIALFVLIWLLRGALSGRKRARPEAPARAELVRCAHCGVHLPGSEAINAEGRHFCSEEHRRLGVREN